MKKKITMEDVAQAAGVSKSTVSQYLNQRFSYMSEETRNKVAKTIEDLDYRPNFLARSLKLKRTLTVGIIIANILHKFSTEVIRAVEDYFHEIGYNVIICNSDNNPEKEKQYIEMLLSKQVDGILVIPTEENVDLYNSLVAKKIPLVFIDRKVKNVNVPAIVTNNDEASHQITEYLINVGYKNVVFISEPLKTYTRVQRMVGYKKASKENNRQPIILSGQLDALPENIEEFIKENPGSLAIIAANDLVFQVVMEQMRYHDLVAGEDFSIIVFDDIPLAKILKPTITTVVQPSSKIGKEASRVLLELIKEPGKHIDDIVLDCEIKFRESTKG